MLEALMEGLEGNIVTSWPIGKLPYDLKRSWQVLPLVAKDVRIQTNTPKKYIDMAYRELGVQRHTHFIFLRKLLILDPLQFNADMVIGASRVKTPFE